ncbi:Erythronate-4-phosphate dehydrogenase family protein [Senna tora]|uniref:Erythronate-4-phosphate dehydrogenase family protein n=1 Tax=Senna tora TaxID=362788 RepID=A0A834TW46_9FABA|nr:Erythronate-4-phosphate dehydrogenase family protein [Senna tora]
MEVPYEASNNGEGAAHSLQIIKYSPYKSCAKLSSAWFDLRVFYVRISHFTVDGSTPEFLTLNHIPLSPDTLLELNGVRSSSYSDGVSSVLRRDRVDKKSEEVTFVSTDSIRLTGSMKFEVYDREDCFLSGILEMSNSNGFIGESHCNTKQWSMTCETEVTSSSSFLKEKHVASPELTSPTIEVYVAGCFSGAPIILTKTLQLNFRKKQNRKYMLDAIPEYETTDCQKDVSDGLHLQVADYRRFKLENEEEYNSMYWQRRGYIEGEDGELSWFNAGVRVGVGIGLGICLGIGVGVGLLVRSYQATTRSFRRRLI